MASPGGSKSRRRRMNEKRLDKEAELRDARVGADFDVFDEESLRGSDDTSRRKFYYLQALREERAERFSRAILLLEKCLEIDAQDPFSWMAITRVAKEARPLEVQSLYERAIAACPTSIHLHHAFAVYEQRIGNIERARQLFRRAQEVEPASTYVAQSWGLLEQSQGCNERARELFQSAIRGAPNTEVCVALARLEAEEGRLDEARQNFETARTVSKGSINESDVYRAWGMVEERFGHLRRAEKYLDLSYRARPTEETVVVLAKLKMRNNDAPGALRLMRSLERSRRKWPSLAAMNAWAVLESRAGNFDEALKVIQMALNRYAKDAGMYLTWGTIEEKRGELDRAVRLYERSIEIEPTAPAFVALAKAKEAQEQMSDVEGARESLREALRVDPRHGPAYNALGLLELRHGDVSRAEAVFALPDKAAAAAAERFTSAQPGDESSTPPARSGEEAEEVSLSKLSMAAAATDASVLHGAAMVDLARGHVQEAREKLRRGVQLTREDTSFLWHSLGTLELRAGRARHAKRVLEEAVTRYPQSSRLLLGLALATASTLPKSAAQNERVRALFRRATEVDKYHPQAWQCWAVFEHRQGNDAAATRLLKSGLTHCREHGALWQAWAVMETHNGNIFSARSIFERGHALCPAHVHLLHAWACMEVRARNILRARELLREALRIEPDSGACYCAFGLLEARHGDAARAEEIFRRGIAVAPRHLPLYRTAAQFEARKRRYERARELFERGIAIDSTYAPIFHAYAEMEGMLGNLGALNELQKRLQSIHGGGVYGDGDGGDAREPSESDERDGDGPATGSDGEIFTDEREIEETFAEDSARSRHMLMEEPIDDYDTVTMMETALTLEQQLAEQEQRLMEEEQRQKQELAANFYGEVDQEPLSINDLLADDDGDDEEFEDVDDDEYEFEEDDEVDDVDDDDDDNHSSPTI